METPNTPTYRQPYQKQKYFGYRKWNFYTSLELSTHIFCNEAKNCMIEDHNQSIIITDAFSINMEVMGTRKHKK